MQLGYWRKQHQRLRGPGHAKSLLSFSARQGHAWTGWIIPVCLACFGCNQPPKHEQEYDQSPPRLSPEQTSEPMLPSFVSLFTQASPSVVNISAAHPLPIPEGLLPKRDQEILRAFARSLGSGFLVDHQGHVVTCHSVVQGAEEIEVILSTGRRLAARVVGQDEISDIAVLSISKTEAPRPLPLGSSKSLQVGNWVAAFGYPFGLAHTITQGMVGAIRSGDEMQASHGMILSDAAINPGCNGGPLLNTEGEVVGINLIPEQTEGSLGLAIPIDDAQSVLKLLLSGRVPPRLFVGVSVQSIDERLAKSFGLKDTEGALVTQVVKGGPADQAGIQVGDVIVSFSGRSISDALDLIETVKRAARGRALKIQVIRQGARKILTLVPRIEP